MDQSGLALNGNERADATDLVTIPGIHRRFVDTFFSPSKMNAYLAAEPRWVVALVVSVALMGLQVALIPSEVWESLIREQSLAQGGTPLPMPDWVTDWMGILAAVGAAMTTAIVIPIGAGFLTVIFAFVLGDEGSYRQYLAVTAHSFFIPALVGLLIIPL
ncbi:MAG: hypothetical protein VX850_04495, partial [Gemmatimonadota bacterium]|nr:hypothetical protein [Gemmatimonadota bacterium]MEC9317760.1 hypothetical protein [Gemmatimonadota bacterium]